MNADLLKWFGGVLAGVGWFILVLKGMADPDGFTEFAKYVLIGLGAHGLTMSRPPSPSVVVAAPIGPSTGQSGRVEPWFLLLLACIVLVRLSAS